MKILNFFQFNEQRNIRRSRGSFYEAVKWNGLSVSVDNDSDAETIYMNEEGEEVTEAIRDTFEDKGGIIIFSTDVNAVTVSSNKLVNKANQILATLKNRFGRASKVTKIMQSEDAVYAFTIGNFVKGRYKSDNGQVFDEKSMSVEIIGITTDTLNSLAEKIAREFKQETVLVKNYQTGAIYLVDGN